MLRWSLAAFHLLGLGIAVGAVWARGHALRGLLRAFAGYEKGTAYYLHNHLFWGKMALLVVVLLLELGPMVALIRWRVQRARGADPDTSRAPRYARISFVQAVLVALMVLAATGMARGYGAPGT